MLAFLANDAAKAISRSENGCVGGGAVWAVVSTGGAGSVAQLLLPQVHTVLTSAS